MKRLLSVLSLAIAVAALSTRASAQKSMTSAEAVAAIGASGARSFLNNYFSTDLWYDSVLAGIKRGDTNWLEVGVMLRRESDAGSSEELGLAFFSALAVKPIVVLPALQRVYGGTAEELCTQTFEAEIPKQGIAKYLQEIERGLAQAKSPSEIALAQGCRKGIAATRKYVKINKIK